jgi:hypothetical protein
MKTKEIATTIESNALQIVNNIDFKSISFYNFLKSEFVKSNVTENYIFQSVFRSFYGLDNVGFSEEFKRDYFKLIEKYRNQQDIDVENVFIDLHRIQNFKGKDAVVFSFVSKLICTIDDTSPIYDKEVCRVFSFTQPIHKDLTTIIDILRNQLKLLQDSYKEMIHSSLIPKTLTLFDEKFSGNNLSMIKKLDFIFWSKGKLDIYEKLMLETEYIH